MELKLMDYELTDRLRNKHRKAMLIAIYEKQMRYNELSDLTGLKPGSIYHHLKTLEPLIKKDGEIKGLYHITDLGKQVVEDMGLVDIAVQKPNIESKIEKLEYDPAENILETIWLGTLNKILAVFTISVVILLAVNGVALAGSAIYAVNNWSVILFDIIAFLLGWGALYAIELITHNKVYNELWFTLTIRLLSMLPGAVFGIGLWLLFLSGVVLSPTVFTVLFVLATTLGMITAATGEIYLRAQPKNLAVIFASIPVLIDVLLGFVVLLST